MVKLYNSYIYASVLFKIPGKIWGITHYFLLNIIFKQVLMFHRDKDDLGGPDM